MSEVKELIAFYEARGWNWLLAAEFVLSRINNGGELFLHCPCCRFKGRGRRKAALEGK